MMFIGYTVFEKVTKKIFSDASSRDDIIHLRRLMNRTPEAKEDNI